MGGMMGGNYQVPAQNSISLYLEALFIGLVVLAVVSVFGVTYFIAFPERKITNQPSENRIENFQGDLTTPYSAVLKALTQEERKIIEILMVHNGKYLQKYLRKEAGITRLKTHRILSRLSERGLLNMKRVGNTNEVVLADWLTHQPKTREKEN
ncbi:MAG: helix-turn-helix transcriptional regulator [Candidatus Bathyarchaeales archaeon]